MTFSCNVKIQHAVKIRCQGQRRGGKPALTRVPGRHRDACDGPAGCWGHGGPSHRHPFLPYTAAPGLWHRPPRRSRPPAKRLRVKACLCESKRSPDTRSLWKKQRTARPGPVPKSQLLAPVTVSAALTSHSAHHGVPWKQ